MTNIAQVLRDARALIDTPDKWAKGWCARLANGKATYAADSDAHSFCAVGSLLRVPPHNQQKTLEWLNGFVPSRFHRISLFNDHPKTTHADIMALFDRAIAVAEAEAVNAQ